MKNRSLQNTIFSLLLLVFLSSVAFAGDPIPGVGVGAGRNPGGVVKKTRTDSGGKFLFSKVEQGTYTITFSKGKSGDVIFAGDKFKPFLLTFDTGNKVMVNGKPWDSAKPITVQKDTKIECITQKGRENSIGGVINSFGIEEPGVK
ncbi:MAG: carboxypeptidase-like regulatory domain-containing protein [bacterium]